MLSLIDNEAQRSMQPPLATDGDYGFGFITNEITRPIGGLGALPELPDQPWNFGAEEEGAVARTINPIMATVWGIATTASVAFSAYHGYKRNDSIGWGIWWGLMGGLFFPITPAIAIGQGVGKRKR